MTPFLGKHFLLGTDAARTLYAASQADDTPIFDWHCHLPAREILENRAPKNIAQLWLSGDHYKWRAMRACGVPERCVSGEAPAKEKFAAWAACLQRLPGNPLFHWAHLELQRYFCRFDVLDAASAEETWRDCNRQIAGGGFAPRELIARSNVVALCTTDDPADSLDVHQALQKEPLQCRVLPAFRPDKTLAIAGEDFLPWLKKLAQTTGCVINSYEDLCGALQTRIAAFDALGCRAADHGLPFVPFAPASQDAVARVFGARLRGDLPTALQAAQYQTALLQFLGAAYAKRGWVMELHMGPLRNNNARALRALGPDTGFDSIGDWPVAQPLARFLDSLDARRQLPRTLLFNLNPRDNYVLGAMLGNFQTDEVPGKLQLGPAWWFLDSIDGMRAQLQALGNLGALGTFVGMETDSRSFLSYPRHEYFRRVFCGLLGDWAEQGLLPWRQETLVSLCEDVFYRNAAGYFGLTAKKTAKARSKT
ncbi:MAG: glucuronate isomerase [Oscillospiraceae bacterium]|jgi:glucuronate isomerase|nr:glucuronate isomerase [Oscillospiraceae bacterium]